MDLDLKQAVSYHNGQFPPRSLDFARLAPKITSAASVLARYDGVLRSLRDSDVLLAPLRRQEAVVSSRIEGTIATLDEVLRFEADEADDGQQMRTDVIEVVAYIRAMNYAQARMNDGLPICARLLKEAHGKLLFLGRGADKRPGAFKTDQNYVVDAGHQKVLFTPISPPDLEAGIRRFENYVNDDTPEPLTQTAVAHLEFEALHPFRDGNGRLGRMLITLMLWNKGLISRPHFYISSYLESRRDEYIDRMRKVSSEGDWTGWCEFFLDAIEEQSRDNLEIAERIILLYEEMKEALGRVLRSQFTMAVLDYLFQKPVFRNSSFISGSGIPRASAIRISRALIDEGFISVIEPAAGRRAALLAFHPLLDVVRR